MKNQYYGDINDYKKYSLIRHLTGEGELGAAVCWVLTKDDNLSDGGKVNYLRNPKKWRKYDPVVFEQLRKDVLINGTRSVENLEHSKILTNCKFYTKLIKDEVEERNKFFKEFYEFSNDADLIFFDPDNGLEIKSVPRGRTKSSKYLYWNELKLFYSNGSSILLYQHFPRQSRKYYINHLVDKVFELIKADMVFSYATSHVLFLLIPQLDRKYFFRDRNRIISKKWREQIKIVEHHRKPRTNLITMNNNLTSDQQLENILQMSVKSSALGVIFGLSNIFMHVTNYYSITFTVINVYPLENYKAIFNKLEMSFRTTWSVTFNGSINPSITNTMTLNSSNGTYSYSIG